MNFSRKINTIFSLALAVILLGGASPAYSAAYSTTSTGGNWTTGSTWTGASFPPNWNNHTVDIYGNVTVPQDIKGFTAITLRNGKSFTRTGDLAFQNISNFTVVSGDIVVNGNFTLENSSLIITSGSLTVTGTFTMTGSASLSIASGTLNTGALTIQNNSTLSIAAGNIVVSNTLTLNNGTLTFNSSGNLNAGAFSNTSGTLNMNSGAFNVTNGIAINSGGTVNVASGATASASSMSSTNNSSAILNNSGVVTISGSVSQGGVINNNGVLNINGNLTSSGSGSSVVTNSGSLNITGNVTLPSSGKLYVNPGGVTVVDGNVTVGSNENLVIGTSVAPPAYADMVIRQNLIATSSGDVRIRQNGRLAVFGDVTDSSGGGTLFTIDNGGQVFIDGDINYSGGGNHINNNNSIDPYGFYTNGTITNSGGGSSTTSNQGDETVMFNTNLPFYNWVHSYMTPLPVTLAYFRVDHAAAQGVNLSWATESESNFDVFIIERSVDGRNFEAAGSVKGAGVNTTTKQHYGFTDHTPRNGRSYYRLKIVDLDGSFEHSAIVMVTLESAFNTTLRLYPNPVVESHFTLELNHIVEMPASLRVLDNTGFEVLSQAIEDAHSVVELPASLKPGVYMVQINTFSSRHMIRIVVK